MDDPPIVDLLLTHQRAELGRAEWFRSWSLALQFLVSLLAAASVFSDDGNHLLALAGVGVLNVGALLKYPRIDATARAGDGDNVVVIINAFAIAIHILIPLPPSSDVHPRLPLYLAPPSPFFPDQFCQQFSDTNTHHLLTLPALFCRPCYTRLLILRGV